MSAHASEFADRDARVVSGRFLTDFFRVLERHEIPASQLLGDLPIPRGERGEIPGRIDWTLFTEFMRRLEHAVGGPEGLEACGLLISQMKPSGVLRSLAGLTASPFDLYRGAIRWALRRALPGIEAEISALDGNHFEIRARVSDSLRPCPQLFHFATGGARALPRILGMTDAVVAADIGETEATYRIALPPSLTLLARVKRVLRSVFSAGSVLHFLEAQQLELHAQHDALQRTHAALAASEQRHRALTDAAVDVLCEIDDQGRIVYISASVQDLIGYSAEQVTGSHYRLWVPRALHAIVGPRFEAIACQPPGRAVSQQLLKLHAGHDRTIVTEISLRSYETPDGEWRMVCTLRDVTDRVPAESRVARPDVATFDPREIERLADAVESVRGHAPRSIRSPHPLQRALQALLRALETTDLEADDAGAERLTEATHRMKQVVDSALLQSLEAHEDADWIEVHKLLDALRIGFAARRITTDVEPAIMLEIGTSAELKQVWGNLDLLASALGSLLDYTAALGCARASATRAPRAEAIRIVLEAKPLTRSDGEQGVAFVLRATASEPRLGLGLEQPPADADDPVRALSLAIARDVASLIGGEVFRSEPGAPDSLGDLEGHSDCGMWIPQGALHPGQPGQSSSRTISAPSERSFSSTRS